MAKKVKEKETIEVNNHVVNVITPMGMEFNQADFWFGDQLGRIILIINYPNRVKIGWLSRIANLEGVTCSIHMKPTNPAKLIENISNSMSELEARLYQGGKALFMKRAQQQLEDAEKLLEKIDREQENVFDVTIAIMVTGRDKEELEIKSRSVYSSIVGSKMRGGPAMFRQEEGLLAVSPYMMCPENIHEAARRNMPISTIAGSYPFNVSSINDGRGNIFGKDATGGVVLLDMWLRGGDRTNSNWTILGAPGVGKSTMIKHLFTMEYAHGTKIIIIDPEREYKNLCNNLGGQWINCGGGSGGRINPLQVKDVPKDDESDEDKMYKDEGKGMGPLALHFQTLRTFFKLYMNDINRIDMALLEETLEELYFSKGITYDMDTSNLSNEDYPIMSELHDLLLKKSKDESLSEKRRSRYEDLEILLRSAAIGADSSLWNGHTTIKPEADFIVLDTHDLQEADDAIKTSQFFNTLTWTWQQVSRDREEKVLVGADEAYLLVDPKVPQSLQFLRNASKRIRKYEGGLAVIAHSAVDFLDPSVKRYGQALMDNPCFKFFMGTDGQDLEELTSLMKLTEVEQDILAAKKRGHGLLIAGAKRIHAIVELADHEHELFGKGGGQ